MSESNGIRGYMVRRDDAGTVRGQLETIDRNALPPGDVLIRVAWSSLNYKDALAAQGHPGVARRLPHIPGIDAAGEVVESSSPDFAPGQSVVVTGNELGAGQWGGWSEYIRVPADWVVPLPPQLTEREAMVLGTAGFTATQCVLRLQQNQIFPESGPIVVTGATGGVGCLAIKLLSRLGYQVTASTGKHQAAEWLLGLGATAVIDRDDVLTEGDKPLSKARWAGAVDTVGGETLASIVRASQLQGCVTCCGLVAGSDLPLTVFPFILRGVTLSGVTSQSCPLPLRREIWTKLATQWRLSNLEALTEEIRLDQLDEALARIRAGQARGRTVVRVSMGTT